MLNYSVASERNKEPILAVLEKLLHPGDRLLEIGSGSGQHAMHFCHVLPEIQWYPTELDMNLAALESNLLQAAIPNIQSPKALDVSWPEWPGDIVSAVYTANTLHIMSWRLVELFFKGVGRCLRSGGLLITYGPFCYAGEFTSDSNAEFDLWLKQRDPDSGIRDIEAIKLIAAEEGLELESDFSMPANNQLLVWRRIS